MAFSEKKYLDLAGLGKFWELAKGYIAGNYDAIGAADDVKVELLGEAETLTTFKAVEGAIEGINKTIGGEDGNGGLAGRIEALEETINGEEGKSLPELVAALDERVTELDKKDGRMDTAEEAIADLEDRVTALDSVAEDSKGRVKVAEEAIAALRADLGVNDKTDTTAFARIEALEAATGETGSVLTEAKEYADNAQAAAITASKVTIAEGAGNGTDVLKTYTFYQGVDENQTPIEIGTIALDIAKDLVVTGGEIVEKDGEKYLSLTIANSSNKVEINVKDLVDVYTGSSEKFINITNDNVVELKVDELDAYLAAEGSTVGDAIKANADAIAEIDKVINGEEGGAGILAQAKEYADSLASNYDAAGSAQAAYDAMKAYTAEEIAAEFDKWNTEA